MQKEYITTSSLAKATDILYRTTKNKVNGTGLDVFDVNADGKAVHVVANLDEALTKLGTTINNEGQNSLQRVVGVSYADYTELQRRFQKMQSDSNALQQRMQKQTKAGQGKNNELQLQIEKLQLDNNDLRSITKQLNAKVSELKDGNIQLKIERDVAQQELKKAETKNEKLQAINLALESEASHNKSLIKESERLVQENESLTERYNRAYNDAQEIENTVNKLTEENQSLAKYNASLLETNNKLGKDAHELTSAKQKIKQLKKLLETEIPKLVAKRWWAWVTYCCMSVTVVSMFSVFGFATIQSIAFAAVGSALFIIAGLASMKFLQTKEMGDWHTGIKCFVFFMAICEIYIHYLSFSSYLDAAVVGSVSVFAAVAAAWVAVMNLIGITIQNKE